MVDCAWATYSLYCTSFLCMGNSIYLAAAADRVIIMDQSKLDISLYYPQVIGSCRVGLLDCCHIICGGLTNQSRCVGKFLCCNFFVAFSQCSEFSKSHSVFSSCYLKMCIRFSLCPDNFMLILFQGSWETDENLHHNLKCFYFSAAIKWADCITDCNMVNGKKYVYFHRR